MEHSRGGLSPPVTMLVMYSCGCGFQSRSEIEAIKHSNQASHVITVNGTIRPNNPRYSPPVDHANRLEPATKYDASTPNNHRKEFRF